MTSAYEQEYGLGDVPGDLVVVPEKTLAWIKEGATEADREDPRFIFPKGGVTDPFLMKNRGKTLALPLSTSRQAALLRNGCARLATFTMRVPDSHAVADSGDFAPALHRADRGSSTAWTLWAL
jgi:hypothetical protein